MRIDAGLDTGDILLQRELEIAEEDTSETLAPKLAAIGAELMGATLRGLDQKTLIATPQDNSQATLAPILQKEDGRMDFNRSAQELFNRLRGFQPWPGAFTSFKGKILQVRQAHPMACAKKLGPGEIALEGIRMLAGCGSPDSALELLEVQLEGKRRMTAQEFINGYHPQPGDRLGI